MKNLALKNIRLLSILFFLFYINTLYSQDCNILYDSLGYSKVDYIKADSLIFQNDSFIMLLCTSFNGYYYYKMSSDSTGNFLEYIDKTGNLFKVKIKELPPYENTNLPSKMIYIFSESYSREYFDMIIIKNNDSITQILPIGSTIYANLDCINIRFPQLKALLENFKDTCKNNMFKDYQASDPVW